MKGNAFSIGRVMVGACSGALLTAVALFVLMFIATGISAGTFPLLMAAVFGFAFGDHWFAALLGIGAAAGAVIGSRQALKRN